LLLAFAVALTLPLTLPLALAFVALLLRAAALRALLTALTALPALAALIRIALTLITFLTLILIRHGVLLWPFGGRRVKSKSHASHAYSRSSEIDEGAR
jgi:hypothetical protein